MTTDQHWFRKLSASFLFLSALIGCLYIILGLTYALTGNFIVMMLAEQYFLYVHIAAVPLAFLLMLYWQNRSQKYPDWGLRFHAWVDGFIRYNLALQIATYGFAKLLGTQFQTTFSNLDTTLASANGFLLTWNYFGHSYVFASIIALLQIGGCILLLFRRTTLAGCLVLLPILSNIVLIDYFYKISPDALLNAVLFTLTLIYLISYHFSAIMQLLFQQQDELPVIGNRILKWSGRFLVLLVAYLSIESFMWMDKVSDGPLQGKWEVQLMIRNQDTLSETAWINDTKAFKVAYFEKYFGQFYLNPNPYIMDYERTLGGTYQFDEKTGQLTGNVSALQAKESDSLKAQLRFIKSDSLQLEGLLGKDSIRVWLKKRS
jgi:hypothetical protein